MSAERHYRRFGPATSFAALALLLTSPNPNAQQKQAAPWRVVAHLPNRDWPIIKLDIDDTAPDTESQPPTIYSLFFVDDKNGWGVGEGGTVVRTKDGGDEWASSILDPDGHLSRIYFANPNRGWACGSLGRQAVVYSTDDGGTTWLHQQDFGKFHLSSANGIWFVDTQHGWIAASAEDDNWNELGLVYETDDGGAHWNQIFKAKYQDGLWRVRFLDRKRGWAIGTGKILHTEDGGRHWVVQARGTQKPEDIFLDLSFMSPKEGWAVGGMYRGEVLHTTDGSHWKAVSLPRELTVAGEKKDLLTLTGAFASSSQSWIGANDGAVLSTVDGGQTWSIENTGTAQNITAMAVTQRAVFAAGTDGEILERVR